ncbi:MAG: glycosyltransferase family 2 protein [Planctomycetes bacterium]|nr:glycosyltransferase family 2 protein [Planctomycetota bacterium]
MISFVIPFVDEEPTLAELFDRIAAATRPLGRPFEVIFVDDGSCDGGAARSAALAAAHPGEVRLIELRGNFGKSAALAAGFDHARGEVVFTLDADLQDDPKEVPRFLEALAGGLDVVSGHKRSRHDPWHKVLPSRVFNWLVRRLTGVPLHDVNCGFKCYRSEVLHDVRVYGELHRFIPVLAAWNRFRVGEIDVEHHPRRHGVSKFGARRFFRGLMDLLTVTFLLKYDRKPLHFFGWLGCLAFLAGLCICGYLTAVWCGGASIGQRPLLTLGVLLILVGVQILATGLLAELLVHVGGDAAPPYRVRRTVGFEPPAERG